MSNASSGGQKAAAGSGTAIMADPPRGLVFVTGATGMVGGHLVEKLVEQGRPVRCLVRQTSDLSLLKPLGVEIVYGDITDDPQKLSELIGEAQTVFHCAAMVDDWADREVMMRANVTGTEHMLKACVGKQSLVRFSMVGSMVVHGMGEQNYIDESAPLIHTGDNYNYTKILTYEVAERYAKEHGVPVVVCRPPYIYGPRDKQFFPRLFENLKSGTFKFIGDGNQPFTIVYVMNLVRALMLAADADVPAGETFLITDGESITRRELLQLICDETGYPMPTAKVPVGVAKMARPLIEWMAKRKGERPILNKFKLKFMATPMTYNVDKARRVLGWSPVAPPRQTLRETIRWYRDHHPEMMPEQPAKA